MIKDIIEDIFSPYSSFGERCLAAFVALAMLIVVGLLGLVVYALIDSANITPTKTVVTAVKEKQVIPAHTTVLIAGKVMIPQFHPESYQLHFNINDKEVCPTVDKNFFDDINVGDKIEVDYGFGRLSGSYQPREIRLLEN